MARSVDLARSGVPAQMPREFTHLRNGLGGDGLTEARQATARVHRNPAADGGVAIAHELLGLARLAQADRFVPVQLERSREVVHLGEIQVIGTDTGLFVRGVGDRRAVAALRF